MNTTEKFNSLYPVGTKVKYYPNKDCKCHSIDAKTIGKAYIVGGMHSVRIDITRIGRTVSLRSIEIDGQT